MHLEVLQCFILAQYLAQAPIDIQTRWAEDSSTNPPIKGQPTLPNQIPAYSTWYQHQTLKDPSTNQA